MILNYLNSTTTVNALDSKFEEYAKSPIIVIDGHAKPKIELSKSEYEKLGLEPLQGCNIQ